MPRRRSHGLTLGATTGGVGAAVGVAAVAVAGCQVASQDNGCKVARQLVLPDTTPLALIPDVQIERAGSGFVLIGADATSVRWTAIDANGRFGIEQTFELPAGTVHAYFALAGAEGPGDRVIIGLLTPAANGSDAELHLVAAPTDGSTPPAPGIAIATFGGGANAQSLPTIAMGTSASAMYAGVAWIDTGPLLPMYAFVDGQGEIVGQPAVIDAEPVAGFGCLGFGPGKQELTISYQRVAAGLQAGPELADRRRHGRGRDRHSQAQRGPAGGHHELRPLGPVHPAGEGRPNTRWSGRTGPGAGCPSITGRRRTC